jgi:hypothetical protein
MSAKKNKPSKNEDLKRKTPKNRRLSTEKSNDRQSPSKGIIVPYTSAYELAAVVYNKPIELDRLVNQQKQKSESK